MSRYRIKPIFVLLCLLALSVTSRAQTIEINTPQWEILGVARPYDPIRFRANLTELSKSIARLDVVPGHGVLSEWVKTCYLERKNALTTEFTSPSGCTVPGIVGFQTLSWGTKDTPVATVTFEISCTDGDACNGMERLVHSSSGLPRCTSAPALCNDYNDCTSAVCSAGLCTFQAKPKSRNCPICKGSSCKPSCGSINDRNKCGFDGCFGRCGPECGDGDMCILGDCSKDTRLGTCLNPINLDNEAKLKNFEGSIERIVDPSKGLDVLVPKCLMEGEDDYGFNKQTQRFPRDPEIIFQIDVPTGDSYIGLEVRTKSTAFTRTTVTIIEADANGTASKSCLDSSFRPWTVWACDSFFDYYDWSDSLTWMMKPGRTYFIAVEKEEGFTTSSNITARFTLTPECTTFCAKGSRCGPSGCRDVDCGTCPSGEQCVSGTCAACIPSCNNVTCGGSDGCGGQCLCQEKDLARSIPAVLSSAKVTECNHLLPKCTNVKGGVIRAGCPKGTFCGSECNCVPINMKLPDLSILPFRAYIDTIFVESNNTCAYQEGCLKGIGIALS